MWRLAFRVSPSVYGALNVLTRNLQRKESTFGFSRFVANLYLVEMTVGLVIPSRPPHYGAVTSLTRNPQRKNRRFLFPISLQISPASRSKSRQWEACLDANAWFTGCAWIWFLIYQPLKIQTHRRADSGNIAFENSSYKTSHLHLVLFNHVKIIAL